MGPCLNRITRKYALALLGRRCQHAVRGYVDHDPAAAFGFGLPQVSQIRVIQGAANNAPQRSGDNHPDGSGFVLLQYFFERRLDSLTSGTERLALRRTDRFRLLLPLLVHFSLRRLYFINQFALPQAMIEIL